jgi:hypothetical protein
MSRPGGRSDEATEQGVVVIDAGSPPAPPRGCGCPLPAAFFVVPLALEILALLLIWPGPAAGDWWFVKALLVALGGLLTVCGFVLVPVVGATRSMTGLTPPAGLELYATAASVLAGQAPRIVALRGLAEPDATTTLPRAPFSGAPCLWWSVGVYRLQESEDDDSGHDWDAVREQTGSVPFWLRDASGRVRVDPTGALVRATVTDEREVFPTDAADAVRELERDLRAADLAVELSWTPETAGFVAQEEILETGIELTVIGPTVVRDGERMIAAADPDDSFSISPYDELDIFAAFRKAARRLQVAAVVVPLAGIAMIAGGFWWILAG